MRTLSPSQTLSVPPNRPEAPTVSALDGRHITPLTRRSRRKFTFEESRSGAK
jgi:hypothetical protein